MSRSPQMFGEFWLNSSGFWWFYWILDVIIPWVTQKWVVARLFLPIFWCCRILLALSLGTAPWRFHCTLLSCPSWKKLPHTAYECGLKTYLFTILSLHIFLQNGSAMAPIDPYRILGWFHAIPLIGNHHNTCGHTCLRPFASVSDALVAAVFVINPFFMHTETWRLYPYQYSLLPLQP